MVEYSSLQRVVLRNDVVILKIESFDSKLVVFFFFFFTVDLTTERFNFDFNEFLEI